MTVDSSVREAMDRTLECVRSLGVTVEIVDVGFKSADMDAFLLGLFTTSMGVLLTEALKAPD
jgi:amidase